MKGKCRSYVVLFVVGNAKNQDLLILNTEYTFWQIRSDHNGGLC